MKNLLLLIFCVVSASACDSDDTPAQLGGLAPGNYQLIEVLADPGNGSGTFQPYESDLTIAITKDGTYSANGSLCNHDLQSTGLTFGKFDIESKMVIESGCDFDLYYEILNGLGGVQFVVYLPCIEPCGLKFASTSLMQ